MDTYAGADPLPLPLTLPQDPTLPPQGEVDWLPQPEAKGGCDEFGPMFGSEGGGDDAGDDDGATDLGEIVVTGERPEEPWWDIDNLPGGGGGSTGGTGTGGGGAGGEVEDPENDEDCGDPADGPTPDGVNLNDIRDEARKVAAEIAALNDDWEWGAIIYVLDGQIYSTTPVTQQQSDSIGFNYSNPGYIPNGAHIVAWVHSHPYEYGAPNQDYMSDRDEGARQTMVDNANGRYTVDDALMSYLLDNELDELIEFDGDDENGDRGKDVTPCGGI